MALVATVKDYGLTIFQMNMQMTFYWVEIPKYALIEVEKAYNCRALCSTYIKIGTIQRRLAWPLRKDDTQNREAFHIFKKNRIFCFILGIIFTSWYCRHVMKKQNAWFFIIIISFGKSLALMTEKDWQKLTDRYINRLDGLPCNYFLKYSKDRLTANCMDFPFSLSLKTIRCCHQVILISTDKSCFIAVFSCFLSRQTFCPIQTRMYLWKNNFVIIMNSR